MARQQGQPPTTAHPANIASPFTVCCEKTTGADRQTQSNGRRRSAQNDPPCQKMTVYLIYKTIPNMNKLQFKKEINAKALKVYETMLGLKDKKNYEYWTAAFNPTSTYEGSWEKGSKILFVGVDETGKKGGMVSEIEELQPAQFVSIRHYGFLDGDTEITTGEQVEKWAGGHENYSFQENNNVTTVTVDMDTIDEYLDYFKNTYPAALDKLKEISER